MNIGEICSRDLVSVDADTPLIEVAKAMRDEHVGIVVVTKAPAEEPVAAGVITDRDIAVRAVADGRGPDTPIDEVMSHEVKYCFVDEELEAVADNMGQIQLRRLPVVDRNKRLVGIVSLGDVAACVNKAAGRAVSGVSKHGGPHSQSARI